MPFDSRYSLAAVESSIKKGHYGVQADSLGTVWTERDDEMERKEFPWLNAYTGTQGGLNGTERPQVWTEGDSFLRIKTGTTITYIEKKDYFNDKNKVEKTIGRYSSPLVRSLLAGHKGAVLSEQYLMENVDYVNDSLDLKGTEISTLPKLKSVGANLTLDTNSKLTKLPELKSVNGKITVVAKNKDEMNQYLQKLGITNEQNEPKIKIKNGIEFIMRSYI